MASKSSTFQWVIGNPCEKVLCQLKHLGICRKIPFNRFANCKSSRIVGLSENVKSICRPITNRKSFFKPTRWNTMAPLMQGNYEKHGNALCRIWQMKQLKKGWDWVAIAVWEVWKVFWKQYQKYQKYCVNWCIRSIESSKSIVVSAVSTYSRKRRSQLEWLTLAFLASKPTTSQPPASITITTKYSKSFRIALTFLCPSQLMKLNFQQTCSRCLRAVVEPQLIKKKRNKSIFPLNWSSLIM